MKRGSWMATLMLLILLTGCSGQGPSNAAGARTITRGGYYSEPHWSPDGKQIVTIHQTGLSRIEVLDDRGRFVRSIPRGSQTPWGPGWLGQDIIFIEGFLQSTSLMEDSTSKPERILDIPGTAQVSWSRSGSLGVLKRSLHGNDVDLWLLNVQSGDLKGLSIGTVPYSFQISPSGRYLAFCVNDQSSGTMFIMDLQTGEASKTWHVAGALGDIVWSPDDDVVGVVRVADESRLGFYLTARNGLVDPLQLTSFYLSQPDWSPVGDRIVYVVPGAPHENDLRVLPLPTGWRERLFGPKN